MTYLDGSVGNSAPARTAAPQPYRESYTWQLVKHAALLGVIAAAVTFVVAGGRSPLVSITYAGSSLVFLAIVALLDRHRFDSEHVVVEQAPAVVRVPGHARTWNVPAPANWQPVAHQVPLAVPMVSAPIAHGFTAPAYDLAVAYVGTVDVT